MAIQINYNYQEFDATVYNAYWRINPNHGIIGGKKEIRYTIEVFKNIEMAHQENAKAIKGFTFSFIPDLSGGAPNFIAQSYNHVKSLPQFHGSVDL